MSRVNRDGINNILDRITHPIHHSWQLKITFYLPQWFMKYKVKRVKKHSVSTFASRSMIHIQRCLWSRMSQLRLILNGSIKWLWYAARQDIQGFFLYWEMRWVFIAFGILRQFQRSWISTIPYIPFTVVHKKWRMFLQDYLLYKSRCEGPALTYQ